MMPSRERDGNPISESRHKISSAKHTLGQDAAIRRRDGDHPGTRLLSAVGHMIALVVPLRRKISLRGAGRKPLKVSVR
jgi:hypothetical protein